MLSIEELQSGATFFWVLALVFAVIAVVLFFSFDIKFLMGELSGKNAKRAIERIKERNQKTEALSVSFLKESAEYASAIQEESDDMKTDKLHVIPPFERAAYDAESGFNETTVLKEENVIGETTVLDGSADMEKSGFVQGIEIIEELRFNASIETID